MYMSCEGLTLDSLLLTSSMHVTGAVPLLFISPVSVLLVNCTILVGVAIDFKW